MLNCQFFIAAQCNPHIVPFFYNCRGGVGRPSRWSSGDNEDAWRGGFLLSALELYLKSDMKAKFHFLHDIEAAIGFTSTMMTQQFVGSTTIVPQVSFIDYFKVRWKAFTITWEVLVQLNNRYCSSSATQPSRICIAMNKLDALLPMNIVP
mmetsp:Transcript_26979/g.62680  ORF Transcript_26979/g.62680 Transcript_26979/m.62680 type:complete len:150 (-) Transcript_26979:2549-2998(-)